MDSPTFSSSQKQANGFNEISLSMVPSNTDMSPMTVKIAPEAGSNMFSWTYGDDELIFTDQAVLKARGFTGAFVLFPFPNRIRNFTYRWMGKDIPIKKNSRLVDIHHQLVFDQAFSHEPPVNMRDCARLTTWIDITPDSLLFEGYPFPCRLTLIYTLTTSGIRIDYTVANRGDSSMPFGFGLHPHFRRLSGDDRTRISIPADAVMEADEHLLPTGRLLPATGAPRDIRALTPLSNLSLDDVFTKLHPLAPAQIDYETKGYGIALSASSDFTHTVVYTGHPQAVCIENQTCATDAINLHSRGFERVAHVITVPPGDSHSGYVMYTIMHKKQ